MTCERGHRQERLALFLYAAASMATGCINLIWRDFESAHEPIQAFGDSIPGRALFACLVAACLIAGGGAVVMRGRAMRIGSVMLACVYSIFAVFWLPRFYSAPRAMGFSFSLLTGLLVGVTQQLILVSAAVIVLYSEAWRDVEWTRRLVRSIFGLSSIVFGLAHLSGVPGVARMVPVWLPPNGEFWAVATGVAFIAAGMAIVLKVQDVLAARLLAVMLFLFSLLVLVPNLIADPRNHVRWGSNAYNLTAAGAVWLFAESITRLRDAKMPPVRANAGA